VIESSDKNKKENSDKNENSKKKEVHSPTRRTYADVVIGQPKRAMTPLVNIREI
jgi:hypothetical protein